MPSRAQPPSRADPVFWVATAAVVVGGLLLLLVDLGRSLDQDEGVAATMAKASPHVLVNTIRRRETDMGTYYVVLRAWIRLGDSEAVIRSLSVAAALGTLFVTAVLARRLFGRAIAILAVALLALNPLFLEIGGWARGYALSLLCTTLATLVLVTALERRDRPWSWALYAVIASAGIYLNFWAALIVVGHLVALWLLPDGRVPWGRVLSAGVGITVLVVPLGLLILQANSEGVDWAAQSPSGRLVTDVRDQFPGPLGVLVFLVVTAAIVAVLVRMRREQRPSASTAWASTLMLACVLTPLFGVCAVSFLYKPLLVPRYVVVALPAALILVAVAAVRLGRRLSPARRWLPAGATLVLALVVLLVGVRSGLPYRRGQDYRDATTYVADHAQPGERLVFFAPFARVTFEWYVEELRPATRGVLQPDYPVGAWGSDPLPFIAKYHVDPAAIASELRGAPGVWLVVSAESLYGHVNPQYPLVLQALDRAGFTPGSRESWRGIKVVHYAPAPSAGGSSR